MTFPRFYSPQKANTKIVPSKTRHLLPSHPFQLLIHYQNVQNHAICLPENESIKWPGHISGLLLASSEQRAIYEGVTRHPRTAPSPNPCPAAPNPSS